MTGDKDIQYRAADFAAILAGLPPVPLPPGPVHMGGASPVDLTAMAFGATTNADLPQTNTQIAADDADRKGHAAEAMQKFATNEGDAVSQFEDVGARGAGEMAQQMPQEMMGAMQGITSALGGAMSSLGQLPQGLMQAGQGALSPLMSAAQSLGKGGLGGLGGAKLASDVTPDPEGLGGGGLGAGGGAGGLGTGTTPASNLGPPPTPSSSMPTTPAGATTGTGSAGSGADGGARGGMGGGGMMPMGGGAGGAGDKGGKGNPPAEKRITAPGVPNGQPVKGRSTLPPNVPVTKTSAGKPGQPTVVTKRIASEDDPPA